MQAIHAIARHVHHKAGFLEAFLQVVAGLRFVFDYEDPHRSRLISVGIGLPEVAVRLVLRGLHFAACTSPIR